MSNYDLNDLPEDVLKEHLQLTERLEEIERVDTCQNNFLELLFTFDYNISLFVCGNSQIEVHY